GPEMVRLPGGRFRMGDIQGIGNPDERPVHEVKLDSFAISRHPITHIKYSAFCRATGHQQPKDNGWGRGNRPVINVTWQDANDYCAWLSEQTGWTYRLPTEAEWEYACRAGSESVCCFGYDKKQLERYAWYDGNATKTQRVGGKLANFFGIYDMHGNVWEWCSDWYQDDFYAKSPANNPVVDTGPITYVIRPVIYHVVRGGSWESTAHFCRSSCRNYFESDVQFNHIGFRVVRDLKK
ncbi:formylglycine-generating enzyme family protein, partial [Desulfobulbus sp. TB]|nr:formylglycine-generating enzyme family protein [Desulfobulbus sp. TB]